MCVCVCVCVCLCVSTMGSQEGVCVCVCVSVCPPWAARRVCVCVCVSTVGSVGQSDLEVGLAELDRHHLPEFTSPGLLVEGTLDHC